MKSKGFSEKTATSNNSFALKITCIHKSKLKLKESYLKKDEIFFSHRNVVKVFIVYDLETW